MGNLRVLTQFTAQEEIIPSSVQFNWHWRSLVGSSQSCSIFRFPTAKTSGIEIIAPVLEIVKLAWGHIGRRIGHVKNLKKNIEKLNNNAKFLLATRNDVQDKITSSLTKVSTKECDQWLQDVKLAEDEVNNITKESREDKKCLAGWCPNVYSNMKLGKLVEDINQKITNLNNKRMAFEGKELSDVPSEKVEPQLLQNVEINSATEQTLQKILGFIKDVKIQKIGIWGMGGVGKTTTLKLLNDQPEVSQTFETVIWVTVSTEGNRRKVQNEIAEHLKLPVSNESDDRLQASICQILRRKKFLLLLDDVWERIDLSDVGIPTLNQDNGCKVVLTTRSMSICQQMETDEEIKVETLTEEQAWHLFKKKVGDVAMFSYIEPIARCIVRECNGLPLAIVVVGSSLRKISEEVMWRNTLRELQLPTTSQIEVMEERVFYCLKSSYDRLQDECKKKLFLYCSLYPEDCEILITELAEYCWLEGFIYGVDSIEEARDKGHSMVINLINAALLERCYDEKCVKMHDVVRDFALREARDVLVKAGMDVKHPLEEKEWWQMQKISLMKSSLCSLLERPNCITLSTLLLQGNDQLKMIPHSFFELMQSLTILDLSGTNISSLPPSLFNLVNLRGLYLRDCNELEDLPSQVRELKQLEVLHLGGSTGIKYLPKEVGELSGLKRLIVGFRYTHWPWNDDDTEEWKMKRRVPTGIIPSLPLLEELSLCVYGCIEEEQWDDDSMKVVVDELCRLEHLTYLDFYFPKEEHLERFLRKSIWGKASWFRRFRFRVGAETIIHSSGQDEAWEGCLIYKGSDEISHVAIMETLAHCSTFHLQEHCATQKLSEFGMENMIELKKCTVKYCDKMETLFDGDDEQETNALLPNLVRLEIHKLPNWRRLWDGSLLPGSLSKLTDLILIDCVRLKKVLQLDIIQQLPSLRRLEVGRSSVEEIIGIEEEMSVPYHAHINSNDTVILPNIKRISLHNLQELVSICQEVSLELPSLETIRICECPKLRSLSSITHGTNNVPPALKMIVGESEWWEALEWEDNDIKQQLQPFFADLYGR